MCACDLTAARSYVEVTEGDDAGCNEDFAVKSAEL
jgi:hypothetical protein